MVRGVGGDVQGYIGIFGESGALDDLQRRLEFVTTHDGLTGLSNRKLMTERLADSLAEARRMHDSVAVLLIDLDNFTDINDTLGHEFGDLLLQQVAERLRRCLCDAHTLARVQSGVLALLALTALTVLSSFLPVGGWHIVIGLGFAVVKALLVILIFMHVLYSEKLTWVVALGGLLWLAILIGMTMNDYLAR